MTIVTANACVLYIVLNSIPHMEPLLYIAHRDFERIETRSDFLHNVPSSSVLAEFCDMLYKIMYSWNETEEYICFNNVEVSCISHE